MHDSCRSPAFRFPDFASDWNSIYLRDALFVSKQKNITEEYSRQDVLSISDTAGVVNQMAYKGRSFAGASLAPYNILLLGQIVYTKSPLKSFPYGIIKYNNYKNGIVSTLYAIYSIKDDHFGPFIEYYFQLPLRLNKYLKPIVNIGAKNDMKVNNDVVLSGLVAFPSLFEQKKIAQFLMSVDDKIEQLKEKKALLEDYKKGVMQQLFTQAIRFKDDHGNDFPDWEEKKLGEVCIILKGKGISKAEVAEDGATPCIRYGELYTDYSELIQVPKSRTDVPTKELVLSLANDVIIPASGETHIDIATASCVMCEGVALGGDLNIIRTKLNGVFLAYYLNNACKHAIARVAQGSSVIHLYPDQLKGLSLAFPSPDEQTKIADFLSTIYLKIDSIATQITETQTFKRGLLQQMFV